MIEPVAKVARLSKTFVGNFTGRFTRLFGPSTSLRATARFLRSQLWTWPVLAAAVLGFVAWWVDRSVEATMRENRRSTLNALADSVVTSLRIWNKNQLAAAELIAGDKAVQSPIRELLELSRTFADEPDRLTAAQAQQTLRSTIRADLEHAAFIGYFVVSPSGKIVACDQPAPIGSELTDYRRRFFDRINAGKLEVSVPFRSPMLLKDEKGELRAGLPTMFAAAPICDEKGKPIAAFGLRIRPEEQFTRVLQAARLGETGETYAFNREGTLVSQSRFDEQLKAMGLIPDRPEERSILNLELRDPEANLAEGKRSPKRRSELPLTWIVQQAVAGVDGCDPDGFRDYRGVNVVGAWRWLEEMEIGIATKVDAVEAKQALRTLQTAFRSLMGLLLVAALAIYGAMWFMARQQRQLQEAALEARRLGQYTLEHKLGEGGMGAVYRARHAMLQRPAAVKLLLPDRISEAALARFEREVQITSGLTHPNTIAVFDYGRTPEGVFYYAMEYLDGIDLDRLVARHGPFSEARALHILRQACGSLAEAHAAGLIHRDIKPSNLLLTCRGGIFDFVKVLDFGLARGIDNGDSAHLTSSGVVVGTPLFLAPEAINHPESIDARADVYSLAAVAYFLVTGMPVFTGTSAIDVCMKQIKETPVSPSQRRGRAMNPEFESLILRCLAKDPKDRPATSLDLLALLDALASVLPWSQSEASLWWRNFNRSEAEIPNTSLTAEEEFRSLESAIAATSEFEAGGRGD